MTYNSSVYRSDVDLYSEWFDVTLTADPFISEILVMVEYPAYEKNRVQIKGGGLSSIQKEPATLIVANNGIRIDFLVENDTDGYFYTPN